MCLKAFQTLENKHMFLLHHHMSLDLSMYRPQDNQTLLMQIIKNKISLTKKNIL